MGAINCKTYDTGEIIAEIRENRRYAIASPSTVTGTPSLAMQSAEQMAVVYIYINDVKLSTPLTVSGTTKTPITVNGANPSKEDLLALSIEVTGITNGEVLYTTDEPNGSPTSPFTTTAERTAWATANLATLRSGVSTAWGPGDSTEWEFVGPEADKWRGIRGPYPGSPSSPFATVAEALPSTPVGGNAYIANPKVPIGRTLFENVGGVLVPAAGQSLIQYNNPGAVLNPGSTTVVSFPIGTIKAGEIGDGIGEYLLQTGYEQGASNTGSDVFAVVFGGVEIFNTGNIIAGAAQLWGHTMRFIQTGTTIRVFYYSRLGSPIVTTSAINVNFSIDRTIAITVTPGNAANNNWVRSVSLQRVN